MMSDPGCGVSPEAQRFRCRLRWALVPSTCGGRGKTGGNPCTEADCARFRLPGDPGGQDG